MKLKQAKKVVLETKPVNQFKQAKDRLEAVRKAEGRYNDAARKAGYVSGDMELWEPYAVRRLARRKKSREAILNIRCPDRRCKFCLEVKTRSRQWVAVSDVTQLTGTLADLELLKEVGIICMACRISKFRKKKSQYTVPEDKDGFIRRKDVFKLVEKRYKLDGEDLLLRRRRAHVTQKRFAEMCGWSPTYQWKLEQSHVDEISEETKNVIESVFKELEDV